MNYNDSELERINRKKALYDIIDEIQDNGISVNWDKYDEKHTLAILRQVVLDYQILVPKIEPDLSEMVNAVDNVEEKIFEKVDYEILEDKNDSVESVETSDDDTVEEDIDDNPFQETDDTPEVDPEPEPEVVEIKEVTPEPPIVQAPKPVVQKLPRYDNKLDQKFIDSIDDTTKEGQIKKVYLELLYRLPDVEGLKTYVNHLSFLSLENVRDAIKKSNEYKRKHP